MLKQKRKLFLFLFILVIFWLGGLKLAFAAPKNFVKSTIFSGSNISPDYDFSFALDSKGQPHFSFYDSKEKNLKYTWYDATTFTWKKEVVEANGDVGKYNSLAIDSNDKPHIAYYDATNKDLKYASKIKGSWTIKTVAESNDSGLYLSMVLDSANRPHIVYMEKGEGQTRYRHAFFTGSGWERDEIQYLSSSFPPEPIGRIAMAINPHFQGILPQVHIATNDLLTRGVLKHFISSPPLHRQEKVIDDIGFEPSLTFDRKGVLAVCYTTFSGSDGSDMRIYFKYGKYEKDSWNLVDTGIDGAVLPAVEAVPPKCSLTFDKQNRPHIAYTKLQNSKANLGYAVYSNGRWQEQILDSEGVAVGFSPYLVLDSYDQPHIAYWASANSETQEIRYIYYDAISPSVSASVAGGIYSKPQEVSLSSSEEGEIYYTLDGQTPTTRSTRYTAPIKISKPTTLKFFARDRAGNVSEVKSENYIITPTPYLYQINRIVNFKNKKVKIYSSDGKYLKINFYPFEKNFSGNIYVTIGDADNDGQGEILVGTKKQVRVFSSTGEKKYSINTRAYRVKVADIDQDGKQETLVQWKNKLKIYLQNKKIGEIKLKGDWIRDFVVFRKAPEKIYLIILGWDGKLRFYENQGGKFVLQKTEKVKNFVYLNALDINNDGRDELTVKKIDGRTYILDSDLATISKITRKGIVTISDIDNDGNLEILISTPRRLYAYKNFGAKFKFFKKYKISGLNLAGRL